MKRYPSFPLDKKVGSPGQVKTLVAGITSPSMPEADINYTQSYSQLTYQLVSTSGGVVRNGSLNVSSPNATATITVANADFFTGVTGDNFPEIYIGDNRLIAGTHFAIGTFNSQLSVNQLASNIADAVNRLKGFTATANLADVEVTCNNSAGSLVTLKKSERATQTCFTLNPSNGYMTAGVQFGSISLS